MAKRYSLRVESYDFHFEVDFTIFASKLGNFLAGNLGSDRLDVGLIFFSEFFFPCLDFRNVTFQPIYFGLLLFQQQALLLQLRSMAIG